MSKTAAAAEAAEAKAVAPLTRDRFQSRNSGVFWNEHEVSCPADTSIDDLARAEYWANVAGRMKPGDNVIAMPEDGAWRAELVVWATGPNWAQLAPREPFARRPDFGPAPGVPLDEFEISYAGPVKKHRIVRKSDRSEVKSSFDSPEQARRWLVDYTRIIQKKS